MGPGSDDSGDDFCVVGIGGQRSVTGPKAGPRSIAPGKYIVVPALEEFELLTADGRFDESLYNYAVGKKIFHKNKGEGVLARVLPDLNMLGIQWDSDLHKATELVPFDKTKIKLLEDEEDGRGDKS